jgi:hypothetical protein
VEILEDRFAPAVFTVTSTGDNGGVNPAAFAGTGTLRQAIIDANATPGADTIQFALPDSMKTAGHNWWTIQPQAVLPTLTDTVLVDGWSQRGAGYHDAPLVLLDGSMTGLDVNQPADIGLNVGADGCSIRGLAICTFAFGIYITGADATIQGCYAGLDPSGNKTLPGGYMGIDNHGSDTMIGGTNPGEGNVISGNTNGIGSDGAGTIIQGNRIGTNPDGTVAIPNDATGVGAGSPSALAPATIGGTNPGEGNLISGNWDGISAGSNVRILGNLIGTDVTGTKALGNRQNGILVEGGYTDVLIGGTDAGSRNVISGNGGNGISGGHTSQAIVQGNYIGTDVNGNPTLGNGGGISSAANWLIGGTAEGAGNLVAGNGAGILLGDSNELVQGNVIRENHGDGVDIAPWVPPAWGNTVSQNAIYGNTELGINIQANVNDASGVTLNDSMGHDGTNHFQNFPVLTGLTSTASGITVTGTLTQSVTPNTSFRIEFFANQEADPSGYGQGERYIGSIDVKTDNNGIASFKAPLDALLAGEEFITATATNLATGDTSEFSKDVGAAVATLTSSATPSPFGQPVTFTAPSAPRLVPPRPPAAWISWTRRPTRI